MLLTFLYNSQHCLLVLYYPSLLAVYKPFSVCNDGCMSPKMSISLGAFLMFGYGRVLCVVKLRYNYLVSSHSV